MTLFPVVKKVLIVCDVKCIEIQKISVVDTPNQPFTRSKELGDYAYDIFSFL